MYRRPTMKLGRNPITGARRFEYDPFAAFMNRVEERAARKRREMLASQTLDPEEFRKVMDRL
jgi:hypothetical protein